MQKKTLWQKLNGLFLFSSRKETIIFYVIIITVVLITTIGDEYFGFGDIFNTIFLILGGIIIMFFVTVLFVLLMKKISYYKGMKIIDKIDRETIQNFYNANDSYAKQLNCYLLFEDYIFMCSDFLMFPRKIHVPKILDFTDKEKLEIAEKTKNRKTNSAEQELYNYYLATLETIKIVQKYYDQNGNRRKI